MLVINYWYIGSESFQTIIRPYTASIVFKRKIMLNYNSNTVSYIHIYIYYLLNDNKKSAQKV